MRKLTDQIKYTIDAEGVAELYAKSKATGKFEKVFTCNASCVWAILDKKMSFKDVYEQGLLRCYTPGTT